MALSAAQAVGRIGALFSDIASETNLLAPTAAIGAARAGGHVAEEAAFKTQISDFRKKFTLLG
ncbi:MAG: hypothetical protein U1F33_01640 [Alphaproteobacteria bacterium]